MNNKIYTSIIKTSVTLFSLVVILPSFTLLAAEPDELHFISRKTDVIDGFYMELWNARSITNSYVTPDQKLARCVRTTGSKLLVRFPRAREYAYDVNLYDCNSNAVPKTPLGKTVGTTFSKFGYKDSAIFGRLWTPDPNIGLAPAFNVNSGEEHWEIAFRVSDYFEVTKPGDYTLKIRFQIAAPVMETGTTNLTTKVIRFPIMDFPITQPEEPKTNPPAQ